jgi:hypothetical protein
MVFMTNTSPLPVHATPVSTDTIARWVGGYVQAWTSNSRADIAALFTEDAEYHEEPFDTEWVGRDEIVDGWRGRWDWQQGGWTFEWLITSVDNLTAVITGIGHYTELGDFDNVWTVTFDESGVCRRFEMFNTERN